MPLINKLQINYKFCCLLNTLKKLYPIFLNAELNRNKSEINKWDMEIDKLIKYKYKDDP